MTFLFQSAVQQLYELRDHYFEHNPIEKAHLKNEEIEAKLKETLVVLDYVQGAYYCTQFVPTVSSHVILLIKPKISWPSDSPYLLWKKCMNSVGRIQSLIIKL